MIRAAYRRRLAQAKDRWEDIKYGNPARQEAAAPRGRGGQSRRSTFPRRLSLKTISCVACGLPRPSPSSAVYLRPRPTSRADTSAPHRANPNQIQVTSQNPLPKRCAILPKGVETYVWDSDSPIQASSQVSVYRNQRPVVCLDFHQVLDWVRIGRGRGDLRLEGENLHSHVVRILYRTVWVVSYCCAPKFRQHVKD